MIHCQFVANVLKYALLELSVINEKNLLCEELTCLSCTDNALTPDQFSCLCMTKQYHDKPSGVLFVCLPSVEMYSSAFVAMFSRSVLKAFS